MLSIALEDLHLHTLLQPRDCTKTTRQESVHISSSLQIPKNVEPLAGQAPDCRCEL
jgi:hypothetical protein